ncbi:MAG: penicillin-binding protein 1C [Flavobacteriaceae bacterium]|nr:penicillin-binding protein 1C [Flavobacteriaceae bacterium]
MQQRSKPHKKIYFFLAALVLLIWFANCLPNPLFKTPTSTVLEDSQGKLLAAKIADDGQWRFPETDSIPDKFIKAITYFEDEYFYYHPGFNPISILRAFKQNISAGKVVSGASTISMQTIRLSRKGKKRNIPEKIIEIFQSIRMEISYSKNEIINLYASHAPFGGNVVGLEAASWRYFGREPAQLSWGEMTALAVLPNAPALIYPGKNQVKLKSKRNRLLDKLNQKGVIDNETCDLAKSEPLPGAPFAIPQLAPHLLDRAIKEGNKGKRIITTIDYSLQKKANKIVENYHGILSENEIHNIAILVLDVEKGTVLSYVGNSNCKHGNSGKDVDIITAPRSTGSILKPFLYAFMQQDGAILPNTLIPDIPTQIAGYSPKNFNESFDGVVPASEALARSLNIPAVRMLRDYGIEKFYTNLKKLNLHTIDQSASHYGLSIILGGAEATLWDLSNAYMGMAQTLNDSDVFAFAEFFKDHSDVKRKVENPPFEPGAIWNTFEALTTLNRPSQETGWQEFQSSQKIAWKTGTSFGHRDAWSIGITPKYVVGVWVGNADGEGRPGLTGTRVAAPILFKVFKQLPFNNWFQKSDWDLTTVSVCKQSGYLASEICTNTKEISISKNGIKTVTCPYHHIVKLDKEKKFRVNSNCYPVSKMQLESWFVLPPIQEWYFKRKNPFYKILPPFKKGCNQEIFKNMDVIYPKDLTKILIPIELNGDKGKAVFEIAHRNTNTIIFWHLDNTYIGKTKNTHRMEIDAKPGKYKMTLVDDQGETLSFNFEIMD